MNEENYRLSEEELEDLEGLHKDLQEKREADRVKAVVLLGLGWTLSQVATALLVDRSTVQNYYKNYKKGGVPCLLQTHYERHRGYLSEAQEGELDNYLQKNLHLTAKSIAAYVNNRWGIEYTESGMTDCLHRLGYVYKQPIRLPGKADASAQKAFLETYQDLKENKGKEDVILFMDAVHPQHNPVLHKGWIKCGKNFQIATQTGRQRLNINGAINIDSLQTVMRYDDSINAQSTIALFKQIENLFHKAPIISIICDNARYYRSKLVQTYLQSSTISLMFLPPYAPNLNLIERYWKYFKKILLYNRYHQSFADFKIACDQFFANQKEHFHALRTLLTENFHIISPLNVGTISSAW